MIKTLENAVRKIAEKLQLTLKPKLKNNLMILYHSKFKHYINLAVGYNEAKNKIFVATMIGAGKGGSDYNRGLFEKLRQNPNKIDNIENFYKGCQFISCVRLNTFKTNIYFTAEKFNSFADYLKIFDKIKITHYQLSPQTCNEILTARNAVGQFKKLDQYNYKYYHWLEFLTIAEYFDAAQLKNNSTTNLEKILKATIEKHLQGMFSIKKVRKIVVMRKNTR